MTHLRWYLVWTELPTWQLSGLARVSSSSSVGSTAAGLTVNTNKFTLMIRSRSFSTFYAAAAATVSTGML